MFACGYRQMHAWAMEVGVLRAPGTAATDKRQQPDMGTVS